jgi:hypothetical protein
MLKLVNGTIAQAVSISLNVSLNTKITEKTLINIFQSGYLPEEWANHISVFYSEIPEDTIEAFIKSYNISKDKFQNVFKQLPKYFQYHTFNNLLKKAYHSNE